MNSLYLLTQLKEAINSAKYCEATPEYRHLVISAELERIEVIADKLLQERIND